MAKFREYGRQWDARIPRHSVARIVARFHVATPETEIENEIASRIRDVAAFPAELIRPTLDYAVAAHRHNAALYARVMGGRV